MQNCNHQIKDINTYILYVLYFLINALFITKYLMRISLSVTLLVLSAYLLAGLLLPRLAARVGHVGSRSLWFAILGFILVLAGMQYLIDPYQIQVDRWSAIHNFINYLVHGRYPYMAPTHLGGYGSPFPVWQFLHIPFYYLNNVGLSLFAVLAFTLYTVKRLYGNRATLCFLACLLYSPAFLYEILVRSDLMANFLLVLAVINLLLIKQAGLSTRPVLFSLLLGMLLSTRLAVAIPFFIFLLRPFLSLNFRRKTSFLLGIFLTFSLTFLPFLLWDMKSLLFFEYNPFVLQTRQGSLSGILLLIPVMIYLAFSWQDNRRRLYGNIGYGLFLLTAVTFIINMATSGNYRLFSPTYDISYFSMSLPFITAWDALTKLPGNLITVKNIHRGQKIRLLSR